MNKSLIVLLLGVAAAGASVIAFTLGSNSGGPTEEISLPLANPPDAAGQIAMPAQTSSAGSAQDQTESPATIGELSTPAKPSSQRVGRISRNGDEELSDSVTSPLPPTPAVTAFNSPRNAEGSRAQAESQAPLTPALANFSGPAISVPPGASVPAAMAPGAAGKTPTAQQQQMVDHMADKFLEKVDNPNSTPKEWSNAQMEIDPGYRKMFGNEMYKIMNAETATAALNGESQ